MTCTKFLKTLSTEQRAVLEKAEASGVIRFHVPASKSDYHESIAPKCKTLRGASAYFRAGARSVSFKDQYIKAASTDGSVVPPILVHIAGSATTLLND